MDKKIKLMLVGLSLVVLSGAFVGCGTKIEKGNKDNEIKTEKSEENYKEVSYVFDNGKEKADVVIKKAPTRAVTLSQFMTEMLLALNLGDRMVGTALLDNPILPQFKAAYDKIPVLKVAEGHSISKEAFMATRPDFVSGWEASISADTTGTAQELVSEGIAPFMAKSAGPDATIDTVYEDFAMLGRIFNVEDNANSVITQMKNRIAQIEKEVRKKSENEKVKVLIYDSGEKDAMVVGGGLPNNLVTLAGGKNVFGDLNKPYETVSFESIVKKNPDVIIVTDYLAGKPAKEKIDFLKNNPALKDVTAIKNNNIHVIGLADLSPGIRNASAIEAMNSMFYK